MNMATVFYRPLWSQPVQQLPHGGSVEQDTRWPPAAWHVPYLLLPTALSCRIPDPLAAAGHFVAWKFLRGMGVGSNAACNLRPGDDRLGLERRRTLGKALCKGAAARAAGKQLPGGDRPPSRGYWVLLATITP